MKLFGLTITRTKAIAPLLSPPTGGGGWWPIIREPFTGAWQRNLEVRADTVLTYSTVFACVTLIASDIAKLWLNLVEKDRNGIWSVVEGESPYWRVLRKPNRYQNRIKFFEWWILSKLIHGNTYALKSRDGRGMVDALYLLDPQRVKPLIAPDGSVFYQLEQDQLANLSEHSTVVPARDIIHDIMCPLYHPLVGVSPIFACGIAAMQGLAIQSNSTKFFENGSQPSGVLTAPGQISAESAKRLQEHWEAEFAGANNVGKVAVLGDGLHYEPMSRNAVDSQLIEQLEWTAETVCSVFHVPPYMVGVGDMPTYNNIEALNAQYYAQCLQGLIECLELSLDEGLEMPASLGTEFDLDALLRMDSVTRMDTAHKAIGSGMAINESRKKYMNLGPVLGGDEPFLQEQNWPVRLLATRAVPSERPPTPPSEAVPPKEFESKAFLDLAATKAVSAQTIRAALRKAA